MNVQKQPTAIASAEYVRVVHGHVTPQGVDWREALSPDYWEHVANRLRPGDRIEVHSFDRQTQIEIIVLDINERAADPSNMMMLDYRAIYPFDLELPPPPHAEQAYYRVRETGGLGTYECYDDAGTIVRRGMYRHVALDEAESRNKAHKQAQEKRAAKRHGHEPAEADAAA